MLKELDQVTGQSFATSSAILVAPRPALDNLATMLAPGIVASEEPDQFCAPLSPQQPVSPLLLPRMNR